MKPWSEKAVAHRRAQMIGLAVTVWRPRRASSRHKSSTRSMDFTKTDLLAPRSMTAIARPMINPERLAEWV